MSLKVIFLWILHFAILPWFCLAECPSAEYLAPHCWCISTFYGGSLTCKDIYDPYDLLAPIEATSGRRMAGITILNSTLRYLPHDLFIGTTIEKIQFIDTILISFTDDDLAFIGLEDHLVEIRASGAGYVSHWDFTHLRNLKKMHLIDIHSIFIDLMAENLPEFPELKFFGLTKANITELSDHMFAKCPQLSLIALHDNHLSNLKRSMFPKPANHLSLMNLQKNKLSVFPDDIFTEMPSLRDLYLNDNQFTTLDEKVFSDVMSRLSNLNLNGNLFRCDCRLTWLASTRTPREFYAKCDKPAHMEGTPLKYLEARDLRC